MNSFSKGFGVLICVLGCAIYGCGSESDRGTPASGKTQKPAASQKAPGVGGGSPQAMELLPSNKVTEVNQPPVTVRPRSEDYKNVVILPRQAGWQGAHPSGNRCHKAEGRQIPANRDSPASCTGRPGAHPSGDRCHEPEGRQIPANRDRPAGSAGWPGAYGRRSQTICAANQGIRAILKTLRYSRRPPPVVTGSPNERWMP